MPSNAFLETPEDAPLSKPEGRKRRKAAKEARQFARTPKPVSPRNAAQRKYLEAMDSFSQVFGIGPAGVGKTYLAARRAARKLNEGEIAKVYIARANIAPQRHEIGFLPGSQDAKMRPWMVPLLEAMREEIGASALDRLVGEKAIEVVPFAFMRGRTFKDAVVIVDEAQNLNLSDFKLLLTRIGENCQYLINGDPGQADIPDSALTRVIKMADRHGVEIAVVEFSSEDVERSVYARQWVRAFERTENGIRF
ncbi:PhoH family protein [Candidatus Macondimonas diazotrophica]|jgi:phosphate starvation-inducible PhoH-like protein|uniref:PhoH-like protein n=1 Tax=Candidatus Macondimonas diazotrophica TaxID=2305248 RepID=A0A4Z0F7E3_9GAMM|nr:PhoH family protein [Candidatus Macondimonas diazotrophica]TFZ81593.1 PhoH family protein [Candidatus Macondimonas diazotrophica]